MNGPRVTSTLVLGLAASVLVACGGDDSSSSTTTAAPVVRLQPLQACLKRGAGRIAKTVVTHSPSQLDSLARQAPGGAVAVVFDKSSLTPRGLNRATFVLEGSPANAAVTVRRYGSVYKALGGNASGLVSQHANAVLAFQSKPSARQRALVDRCLL